LPFRCWQFGFAGITYSEKEIPVSHVSSLASVVLAYSVVRHELINIHLGFRKALAWACWD
jgi:hypothetical protein